MEEFLLKKGYEIIDIINKGAYGSVYKAITKDNCIRAVKVISKEIVKKDPFMADYIDQEIESMKKVQSVHTI